jgi:predicted TPR repeat methyltransferase
LFEDGVERRLRLHDYDELYKRPGLYEQVYHDRLQCTSPVKVDGILQSALSAVNEPITELRVFDLGAGNGIMGETLKSHGVARLVGVDILPEAQMAAFRDRPDVYDDYHVVDLTALSPETTAALRGWSFNCLTSVAALGFGDVPPLAFINAMRFINTGGWLAINIKETFLDRTDRSGFSTLVRELIASEVISVHHLERYRHRLSMEGRQLFYFALVARLNGPVPDDFMARLER